MYGASLRRLAPNLYDARAGWRHRRYGDPYTFGARVRKRHRIATISGGLGRGTKRSNLRCQIALLRLLGSLGYARARWKVRTPGGWRRVEVRLSPHASLSGAS